MPLSPSTKPSADSCALAAYRQITASTRSLLDHEGRILRRLIAEGTLSPDAEDLAASTLTAMVTMQLMLLKVPIVTPGKVQER